jgi:hypothetical protein
MINNIFNKTGKVTFIILNVAFYIWIGDLFFFVLWLISGQHPQGWLFLGSLNYHLLGLLF